MTTLHPPFLPKPHHTPRHIHQVQDISTFHVVSDTDSTETPERFFPEDPPTCTFLARKFYFPILIQVILRHDSVDPRAVPKDVLRSRGWNFGTDPLHTWQVDALLGRRRKRLTPPHTSVRTTSSRDIPTSGNVNGLTPRRS
jgi:hypothetical protein